MNSPSLRPLEYASPNVRKVRPVRAVLLVVVAVFTGCGFVLFWAGLNAVEWPIYDQYPLVVAYSWIVGLCLFVFGCMSLTAWLSGRGGQSPDGQ
jgi:hypothetical protein